MSWFGLFLLLLLFALISPQEKKQHTPIQQLHECSASSYSQGAQIWAHPFH